MSHQSVCRSVFPPFLRGAVWLPAVLGLAALGWTSPLLGQADEADAPPAKKAAKNGDLPEPEDTTVTAADGLKMALTYYPAPGEKDQAAGKEKAKDRKDDKRKEAVPVVLLHGYRSSRKDPKLKGLSLYLQRELGCAVVVPDLRGHGQSTQIKGQQRNETVDAIRMKPADFARMFKEDCAAIKDFLWNKNNDGELNIDKLCVIGCEMGAGVALGFAAQDASGYEEYEGKVKVGQHHVGRFIKALVLVSPEQAFKGLKAKDALDVPAVRNDIAVMILVGKKTTKAMLDAKQIHTLLKLGHPNDDKTLMFGKFDTSLQGAKLLDEESLDIPVFIGKFINVRMTKAPEAKDWVWKERKRPYE